MEEEYRERLVSVSLSDTNECLVEEASRSYLSRYYSYCKKPLKCIIKSIKKLVGCFSPRNKEKI